MAAEAASASTQGLLTASTLMARASAKAKLCPVSYTHLLAVFGGVDTPPVLGSRSTDLKCRMGGLDGRALKAGDVLPIGAAPAMRCV